MISLISFLIVISICVIVHEGGHYLAARWRGVMVHEFSLGMGPVLFSKQSGETLWSIRAFPVGGFVRLEGEDSSGEEDDTKTDPSRSLVNKRPWERLAVISAGALVNLFLAWVITAFLLSGYGVIDLSRPIIGNIMPNSPALSAGLEYGDELISIDGEKLKEWSDIRRLIQNPRKEGDDFTIELKRGDKIINLKIAIPKKSGETGRLLGVQPARVKYSISQALTRGLSYSWAMGIEILRGLWMTLTGQVKSDVVGPVGIAVMAGDAFRQGFWSFIAFLGIINLHLGLLNLLPFPALDGGRIVFILIEILTRRKVPEKWEAWVHYGGFVILITLIILITGKDILRLLKI